MKDRELQSFHLDRVCSSLILHFILAWMWLCMEYISVAPYTILYCTYSFVQSLSFRHFFFYSIHYYAVVMAWCIVIFKLIWFTWIAFVVFIFNCNLLLLYRCIWLLLLLLIVVLATWEFTHCISRSKTKIKATFELWHRKKPHISNSNNRSRVFKYSRYSHFTSLILSVYGS